MASCIQIGPVTHAHSMRAGGVEAGTDTRPSSLRRSLSAPYRADHGLPSAGRIDYFVENRTVSVKLLRQVFEETGG
jgi:hypothetical protein